MPEIMGEYQEKGAAMRWIRKTTGNISKEEIRELKSVKLDNTDFLLGKVLEGNNTSTEELKAIVVGTDNVYEILARKKELRAINLYVSGYGLDAIPCVDLYLLFTKYFPNKIIVIETPSSKSNKICIAVKGYFIDLMSMCMGYGAKIRFSAIMDKSEFNLFGQVLLLLREDGPGDDWCSNIMKGCGNDIIFLKKKLSQLTAGRLLFSRSKPKPFKKD